MPTLSELLEKASNEKNNAKSNKFGNERFKGRLFYSVSGKEQDFVKKNLNKKLGEKDGR